MRKAMSIVTTALLIIGIIHVLLTPMFHGAGLTVASLWFASFGLALMFLAFLNYTIMKSELKSTRLFVLGYVANLLTALLVAVLLTCALYPHIILLFVLLVVETVLLLRAHLAATPSAARANQRG